MHGGTRCCPCLEFLVRFERGTEQVIQVVLAATAWRLPPLSCSVPPLLCSQASVYLPPNVQALSSALKE